MSVPLTLTGMGLTLSEDVILPKPIHLPLDFTGFLLYSLKFSSAFQLSCTALKHVFMPFQRKMQMFGTCRELRFA